jgi:clan AA aspartic protease (TIGR02281 family)
MGGLAAFFLWKIVPIALRGLRIENCAIGSDQLSWELVNIMLKKFGALGFCLLMVGACSKPVAQSIPAESDCSTTPTPTPMVSEQPSATATESEESGAACGLTPPAGAEAEASAAAMPSATPTVDLYQDALNTAAAARSIASSALSKEDWVLVADQWQASIKLLQGIPKSHSNYKFATQILPQYQQNLADARQKSINFKAKSSAAAPLAQQISLNDGTAPVENSRRSFSIPIIKKLEGVPIVEVTINGQERFQMMLDTGASRTLLTKGAKQKLGLQPIGSTAAKTANGTADFETVAIDSIQFGEGVASNLSVAVANDSMNYGLLGHDVYQGYDITLREDSVLFEKR